MKDKRVIIISLVILIILLGVLFFLGNNQRGLKIDGEVTITTDKQEYETGEGIEITINNNLDEGILYFSSEGMVWNIEELKDGHWNYT